MTADDEALPVRPEAAFDAAALGAWLRAHGEGGGFEGTPELLQFGRGYSNLTYLVRFGNREIVVRRAPPGVHIKSAHDMGREFRILRALAPAWSKVPGPIAYCEDAAVIGSPFYAMDRVRGIILRGALAREETRAHRLDAITIRRASEALADTLAEIHCIDWRAAGLTDLGRPEGYIERQVRGWGERWRKSWTDDVPQMERLGAWLEEHRPRESGSTLVHNDFKYDNVVFAHDLGRVVTVLDWEMATIGDPLMDLGTTLGYWVDADDPPVLLSTVSVPTHLRGNLTRLEVVHRWSRATGRDAANVTFYYAFALFKLAVVKQQLHKRWASGLTTDERYGKMLPGVRAVATAALLAIERGRIDRLG
jgi:aminoglycoside phosphotransferase (APT) family kinase protein